MVAAGFVNNTVLVPPLRVPEFAQAPLLPVTVSVVPLPPFTIPPTSTVRVFTEAAGLVGIVGSLFVSVAFGITTSLVLPGTVP